MRFAAALSALSFAAIAAAQDATIQVGATAATAGGIFQFMPPTINATKGSTITFVFSGAPGNHTVTQSTFASPCQQAPGGFDSGYIQIPAGTTGGFPTWNLTITDDTKPIWFFCAQLAPAPHCTAGMVGGINVPASGANTFTNFKAAAIALAANNTLPSPPAPALSGAGAAATAAPGPFSGAITGFAIPSGTAPPPAATSGASSGSGSGTGSTPAPTNTGSGAVSIAASGFVAMLSALFGITLM